MSPEVAQLLGYPVSSAISRVVIKSDQKIPTPGQVVGVVGKSGLYIVMNVDRDDRVVQLMEKEGRHRLTKVPISSIRAFNQNLARAIRRFLDARDETEKDR